MAGEEIKPRARGGLLTSDHSKKGRRFVTILDPDSKQVTLLEPWEHGILVLCDGSRDIPAIAKLLESGIDGEPIDVKAVRRALKFFEREKLVEGPGEPPPAELPPPGPRTLAKFQLAYREWHKDPRRGSEILSGKWSPFDPQPLDLRSSLDPTVALPDEKAASAPSAGATLYLANADSLLQAKKDAATVVGPLTEDERSNPWSTGKPGMQSALSQSAVLISASEFEEQVDLDKDVAELLAEVDADFREVEDRERREKPKQKTKKHVPPPMGKAIVGEAVLPETREMKRPPAKVMMEVRPEPEKKLQPTVVGVAADETAQMPPVILAPARPPTWDDEATARLPALTDATPPPAQVLVTLEDVSQIEGPTEGAFTAASALAREPSIKRKKPSTKKKTPERVHAVPTASMRGSSGDLEDSNPAIDSGPRPSRAKEVFDRLRKAGLKARNYVDQAMEKTLGLGDHPMRRRDEDGARRFDEALRSLSAGDLEVALKHFRRLAMKMPESRRLAAFIEAIEAVRTGQHSGEHGPGGGAKVRPASAQPILESFEGLLEEAIAYGRCPACFSMVQANFTECFACGFALSASPKRRG